MPRIMSLNESAQTRADFDFFVPGKPHFLAMMIFGIHALNPGLHKCHARASPSSASFRKTSASRAAGVTGLALSHSFNHCVHAVALSKSADLPGQWAAIRGLKLAFTVSMPENSQEEFAEVSPAKWTMNNTGCFQTCKQLH